MAIKLINELTPTSLQTERGYGFVRAKSPSPVWERDLGRGSLKFMN